MRRIKRINLREITVYHIHRSSRIARASQSETSSYTYIRERTRLEMESAERQGERDLADNPAVGFRQTSPSYRIGDPFGNEYRGKYKRRSEKEGEWWGIPGRGWARVKARLRMSRSCRRDRWENWGWTEKERTRESLSGQMIPTGGGRWRRFSTARIGRENAPGDKWGGVGGWGNKKGGRKERNGIPWKVFRPAIRQLLDLTLFQIRPDRRPTGAFYSFRSPSRRRCFPLT